MNLFKTTLWNGIATILKVLTGLVTTKIVAIYLGPVGIALMANFNNVVSIFSSISNGAISNGIIKYVSEYTGEKEKQENIISNAIKINLIFSICISIFILVFYKQITLITMKDLTYSYATRILGISILMYGLNLSVSAILNGYRDIKQLILNNMITSIISMLLSIIITRKYGLYGALINGMIIQFIVFIINIYFIKGLNLINLKLIFKKFDKDVVLKLIKFSSMSIISALVMPLSTLVIRNFIINEFSIEEAGYLQGIWSISNNYLMVVITTLSVYYLPTLSSIKNNYELKAEIVKGYKFILPIAVLGGLAIFIFKDIIIITMYTREFLPMREYFTFQILGDTLKIASFLLSNLMLAKAMTKHFIISEIIFSFTNIILSIIFMKCFGLVGQTYAYSLNYAIYLISMIVLFREILITKHEVDNSKLNNIYN